MLFAAAIFLISCDNQNSSTEQQDNDPPLQTDETSATPTPRLSFQLVGPWSADIHELGADQGSLVVAISHKADYIELWRIHPDRQTELVAKKEEIGFHPDQVRWVNWADQAGTELGILVVIEGGMLLQLWRWNNDELQLEDTFKVGKAPRDAVVGDLDQDGFSDLVVGPYSHDPLMILRSRGDFTFDLLRLETGKIASHPRLIDWDQDGRLDIAWTELLQHRVMLARSESLPPGELRFEVSEIWADTIGSPRGMAFADLNDDSYPDMVVALETGRAALVFYNDGKGGVLREESIPAPTLGYRFVDIHGAGKEAILALSAQRQLVLARQIDGEWQLRSLPAGDTAMDPSFGDADGDGIQDVIFSNVIEDTVEVVFGPLWEQATPIESDQP